MKPYKPELLDRPTDGAGDEKGPGGKEKKLWRSVEGRRKKFESRLREGRKKKEQNIIRQEDKTTKKEGKRTGS